VANEPRFAELPPARVVPALADEGRCIVSESSFYRVLRAHHQLRHRGRAHAPTAAPKPTTTHRATRPRHVWCWDMAHLPTTVIGQWFHLYLILDLYSRKIVGFTVEATDHSDHAAHLLRRTALDEGIHALADKPVLHGANATTLNVTPAQRHHGQDHDILAARNANPVRWSGHSRNWTTAGSVTLNPDRNPANPDASTCTKSMPMTA
jgi:transposase InsO family protein